jgi:hypothetical protein
MELSDKENKLLELIKTSTEKVTVKLIEEKLGKQFVGGLGKLIGKELIEIKKDRGNSNYGMKKIKYYRLKVKKEE